MRFALIATGAALALLPVAARSQAPLAAESCVACHGPGGIGSLSVPGLAGRPAAEIIAAMAAFRAGSRPASIMDRIARGFTEAEIAAAAARFAALPAGGPGR